MVVSLSKKMSTMALCQGAVIARACLEFVPLLLKQSYTFTLTLTGPIAEAHKEWHYFTLDWENKDFG